MVLTKGCGKCSAHCICNSDIYLFHIIFILTDSRSNPDGYALRYHLARPFSTYDRDNDPWSGNCAINRHGAWWYNECAASNFNGEYFGPRDSYRSIEWETLPGSIYNIQFTEMKIRPFAG